ncbi:MAG: IclR family transcriptional regulator [Desulfatiglandales bacterium]|jgi:DNA-binding IclR family transcriptional regulator|nr:IclR family transcriptional regulator [Desulfatiglandales bacterium]
MSEKYQAPSVKKAFQILRLISGTELGLGISDLAKSLGISKGTIHGITSTLEELGAIKRDPRSKRYTSGFTLLELGKSAYSQFDLLDHARPIMQELMEGAQESVFFGVLNAEHVTVLDIVESRQALKITSPIGTTIPLSAGATGKIFLASMEEEKAMKIIRANGLTRYTENTITDPEQFMEEIRRVKEKGYATDYEEYLPGVRAVVSPIRGERHLVSAIWVVGFKVSLDDNKMKALIGSTKEAAEAISRRI